MNRKLYELIERLTDLAADGVKVLEADADGPDDRLAVAEAQATIVIAQHYVDEYREQYESGDLK